MGPSGKSKGKVLDKTELILRRVEGAGSSIDKDLKSQEMKESFKRRRGS